MKITATWHAPFSLETLSSQVSAAGQLGFDAFAWTASRHDEPFIKECGKNRLLPIKVLAPLKKRENARLQVLHESEQNIAPLSENHQFGGDPAAGSREVLDQPLLCPHEGSVVSHALKAAADAINMGCRGICWDFVGFRNYRTCHCEICRSKSGESALIDVYDKLYSALKGQYPDITVMAHSHPVFLPNPFFAQQAMLDYCALTVSWFFQPHWDLSKVSDYAIKTIKGPYKHPFTRGMPMVGFCGADARQRHFKNPARISAELRILRQLGAKSIMVAELSDILAYPEITRAVKENIL